MISRNKRNVIVFKILCSLLFVTLLTHCSKTVEPSLAKKPGFRFVVLADSRGDYKAHPPKYLEEKILYQVTQNIIALDPKPQFVIFNGDMIAKTAYKEAPETIKKWKTVFLDILRNNGITVYIAPGNHVIDIEGQQTGKDVEYISLFKKHYLVDNPSNGPPRYGGVTYSFDYQNVHFVTVTPFTTHNGWDNTELKPEEFVQKKKGWEYFINKVNLDWLENDLKMNDSDFTVFFTHVPIYAAGPHYKDKKGLEAHPINRDRLTRILIANNTDVVFSAHEHLYARANLSAKNPTDSVLTGKLLQVMPASSGAPFSGEPPRDNMLFDKYLEVVSYLVADVEKRRIVCTVYDEEKRVIDKFAIKRK